MLTPLKRTAIENMCAALEGTARSASEYQRDHGLWPLTDEEQEYMDEIIFQCPECGYWTRSNEMVDSVCIDCYEEELEQEDDSDEQEE